MDSATLTATVAIAAYMFAGGVTQALLSKVKANTAFALVWPLSFPFALGAVIFNFACAQFASENKQPVVAAEVVVVENKQPVVAAESVDVAEVKARLENLEKSFTRVEALLQQRSRDNKKRMKAVEKVEQKTLSEIPEKNEIPEE